MNDEHIDLDVRGRQEAHLLERCQCGQEYITDLHLRHECPDCLMKRFYPPNGIKPEPLFIKIRKLWYKIVDV